MSRAKLIRLIVAVVGAIATAIVSYDQVSSGPSHRSTATTAASRTTATRTTATQSPARQGTATRPILTRDRLEHIEARHWPGTPSRDAGKFARGITPASLEAMIDEAVLGVRGHRDSDGRTGIVYDYRFDHTIGVDIDGDPTRRIRVVVGTDNHVITAYPI